jgi:hypothetical protein
MKSSVPQHGTPGSLVQCHNVVCYTYTIVLQASWKRTEMSDMHMMTTI